MISKNRKALITAIKKGYLFIDGDIYYKKNKIKLQIYGGNSNYRAFGVRMDNGKMRYVAVHRFVAYQKFGNKIFKKGMQVRHLDSNSLNNNYDNIGIGTSKENNNDKHPDTRMRASLIACSFTKKHNHEEIIKMKEEGFTYKQIMSKFNIKSKGTISFIINESIASKK
ncbi:MAG TPA: HNH endonuclease [Bacteroidia bacterium]|jgi:hypothetical protein|nr:HNH endonuclease [Bacteroidia bacterium]